MNPESGPLALRLLGESYSISRLPADAKTPSWAEPNSAVASLVSVARTEDELSIVCPSTWIDGELDLQERSDGWRCLRVEGTLDFSLVGILAELSQTLANAGVALFAVSTFDTDYLLVGEADLEAARNALSSRGHRIKD